MKKTSNKQLLFAIPAIMGFAMSQAQNAPTTKEPGINVANMDTKVKPSDDFLGM